MPLHLPPAPPGRPWLSTVLAAALVLCAGCTSSQEATHGRPSESQRDEQPEIEAEARVLHVEPRGDDAGDGDTDDPFGSLQVALSELRAGDTLVVGGGTYDERVDIRAAAGRRDAPVRVVAAAGERPLLRGLLWLEEPSWWRIEGVNVTWSEEGEADEHMVKITGGQDWVVSDAEIWGARSFAAVLVAGKPERFTLRNLHVHDTLESNGRNEDHLLYLNSGRGGGTVEGCLLVSSPNGRAIKVGPADDDGPAVANLVIRYNTMVDNFGPSNVQLAWRTESTQIYRNIMVGAGPGRANVTAYDLDGDDNIVRDNVGWRSTEVLEPDVDGLVDGGGNMRTDPRLAPSGDAPLRPALPEAQAYGHTVPIAER